jgi:hypothetical protein
MLDGSEAEIDRPAVVPSDTRTARTFRYDVFLRHNIADKPFVKLLADALQIEAGISLLPRRIFDTGECRVHGVHSRRNG